MLFILLFVFQLHAQVATPPYIISGFDDVLRQAENTGLFRAALKILEEDKTYAGMPELYREMSKSETVPNFVLVSAISHWFDPRIERFLVESKYPAHHRMLRNWLTQWSINEFKLKAIEEIIASRKDREFIVIFDNSNASIEMAPVLRERFPQIKQVYLRQVVEKSLPKGASGFFTAFDIALAEYEASRLGESAVQAVAQALLQEKNKEFILPSYGLCPKDYRFCADSRFSKSTPENSQLCAKVEHHLKSLCH